MEEEALGNDAGPGLPEISAVIDVSWQTAVVIPLIAAAGFAQIVSL